MTYPFVELKNISEFINGFAFKPEHWEKNGKPIIRIQNLTNSSKPFNRTSFEVDEKYFVSSGDILVSWSATLDVFEWQSENALLNQHIFKVVPDYKIIDKNYFKYALKEAISSMMKFTRGSTMKHINRGDFLATKIPLPPLETQKQIAQVLATADQLRKDCQQVEQELNALAQSVFLEMFGDPVTNPKGWEKVPVSYFVNEFQGGKSVASAGDEKSESTYRVLKISAVTWKDFNPLESKPLPNDHKPNANHFVKQNDLLFSRANTKELVGATSYVFETPNNILLPDKLWRFVWKQETKVAPLFIWYLFLNEGIRYQLGKLATGSGGSMKNISKSKLMPFKVIFPSYEQQKKFSAKIKHIRELQKINLAEKGRYEILFNSLLQKAFKGELNLKSTL